MSTVSTQACAACKYQRRKCSADCPLAPYFPPDQPKQFLNVHRLFGVSNVLRILRQVDPSMKADAIKSIVYEADAWEHDPVHGCLGLISILQNQVEHLRSELDRTRSQIFYLEQSHQMNQLQHSYTIDPSLISTNPVYVHPNLSSTNQTSDFGSSNAWVLSEYNHRHEQRGVDGSGMFNGSAGSNRESGGLQSLDGIVEHNSEGKIEVGEAEAATYDLHEAVSASNRSDYSLYQGPPLTSLASDNVPKINSQDDKDDLKTAANLFSLTRNQ